MKKYLRWIPAVIWALIIWRLTTTPQIVITESSLLQAILMMFAHFIFFGIQAGLLYFSFPHRPSTIISQSLIITSLYGALIEFRQLSVPGRTGDPFDWALDTLGAITFLFLLKKLQSKS